MNTVSEELAGETVNQKLNKIMTLMQQEFNKVMTLMQQDRQKLNTLIQQDQVRKQREVNTFRNLNEAKLCKVLGVPDNTSLPLIEREKDLYELTDDHLNLYMYNTTMDWNLNLKVCITIKILKHLLIRVGLKLASSHAIRKAKIMAIGFHIGLYLRGKEATSLLGRIGPTECFRAKCY